MYYDLYDVSTVHWLNVVVPIAFREKENIFPLLNSFFKLLFSWNAETNMEKVTRCFYPLLEKKNKDNQRSGSGNIKIPTCRFFKELEFLKDRVKNKSTTSNVHKVNNIGNGLGDILSPPYTPVPSASSTPDTN